MDDELPRIGYECNNCWHFMKSHDFSKRNGWMQVPCKDCPDGVCPDRQLPKPVRAA